MNYAENIAKHVIEAALGKARLNYRIQQSSGEWDFDMLFADGTFGALEVTAAVDRVQAETVAAIHNKKRGGGAWSALKCQRSWVIYAAKGAQINRIRENAETYLCRLEYDGVERFFWPQREPQSVCDLCRDLQIVSGGVIDIDEQPTIRLALTADGVAVGPSLAVGAGEQEAWKPDNRKKLGAASWNERHIAVYIDALNGLSWAALTEFQPPHALPNLPAEITTIWLVGHTSTPDKFIAWYGSKDQPWRKIEITKPLEELG